MMWIYRRTTELKLKRARTARARTAARYRGSTARLLPGIIQKNQIMAAEIHDRFRIFNIRAMRIGLVRLERVGYRRYIANEPQAETDVFRPLFAMNTIAY